MYASEGEFTQESTSRSLEIMICPHCRKPLKRLEITGTHRPWRIVIRCPNPKCGRHIDPGKSVDEMASAVPYFKGVCRQAIGGDCLARGIMYDFLHKGHHLPNMIDEFDDDLVRLLIDSIKACGEFDAGAVREFIEQMKLTTFGDQELYAVFGIAVELLNLLFARAGNPMGFLRICGSRASEFDAKIVQSLGERIAPVAGVIRKQQDETRIHSTLIPVIQQMFGV